MRTAKQVGSGAALRLAGIGGGIITAAMATLPKDGGVLAWLGPGICREHYPVGPKVREWFLDADAELEQCFSRIENLWHADLYAIARRQLMAAGIGDIYGGYRCTFHEPEHFFSHRREQLTGRHGLTRDAHV